ncbi:MAG: D-alanine--D-alanine ligase family protein [Aggregatilineales bacterium]
MQVGITCNLRTGHTPDPNLPPDYEAEFDSEATIQTIEAALAEAGHAPVRIGGIRDLVQFLADGRSVDIVFNIAEGTYGRSREAQVPALLEAYGIPYTLSDPLALALSLDKSMTKRIWHEAGLPTAPFWTVTDCASGELAAIPDRFPLFAKPSYEGSSKGISEDSVIHDRRELEARVAWINQTYQQPALIERFLPGREYTVGILGNGSSAYVLGIAEITSVRVYPVNGFEQKEYMKDRPDVFVSLPETDPLYSQLSELALAAFRAIDCHDAARVDIRFDSEKCPNLLEINPISGLHPTHSALPAIAGFAGMRYAELIQAILEHAMRRYGLL